MLREVLAVSSQSQAGNPLMDPDFFSTDHLSADAVVAFVDDALPRHVRIRVERHITECPECCALVNAQREIRETIQSAETIGTPGSLREKLARIPNETALLEKIIAEEGEEAALRYAQEHNLSVTSYLFDEPSPIRSEIQMFVVRFRRTTRGFLHKWLELWRRGM